LTFALLYIVHMKLVKLKYIANLNFSLSLSPFPPVRFVLEVKCVYLIPLNKENIFQNKKKVSKIPGHLMLLFNILFLNEGFHRLFT